MTIRRAVETDADSIWEILEPVIRAGETYTLPRELSREDALAYWFGPAHEVWIAEERAAGGVMRAAGTYFLQPNQGGGGSHVANCGYITARGFEGRGVARAMCAHSLERARERGFRAMQFNFVVSANVRAVRLWESLGFEIVGRLPGAFLHPDQGYVDALVMFRAITLDTL
jgi:ribosomal protein S18 acetylase RimI-like enzyme